MADKPENSDHTSIKERIKPVFDLSKALRNQQQAPDCLHDFNILIKPLLHFESSIRDEEQHGILFSFSDYLKLVDATGRCIRQDKRGSIPDHITPILQRLNIDEQAWLINTTAFENIYQKRFSKRTTRNRQVA